MSYTDILLDAHCTSYRTKVDNDLSDPLEDYIASARKIDKLIKQLKQTKIYEKSIALNSAKGQAGLQQAVTALKVLPVPEEAITPATLEAADPDLLSATETTGTNSHSPTTLLDKPDKLALELRMAMDKLREEYMKHIDTSIDMDKLVRLGTNAKIIATDAYPILISNAGTTSDSFTKPCPVCNININKHLAPRDNFSHYLSCSHKHIIQSLREECAKMLSDAPCPLEHCKYNFPNATDESIPSIMKHIALHWNKCGGKCGVRKDNGNRGEEPVGARSSINKNLYRCHLESMHGLHHPNPDSAVFCEMHEKWLVGENQVRQHYLEHISTNTLATMSTNERQVTCPFCYVNQNLTPLDRAKTFAGGAYGSILQHLRTQHLDDLSGNTLLCPVMRP
jgi:hypothetical protein